MPLPMFLVQMAIAYAASTIKNPASAKAQQLKEYLYPLFLQMKSSFTDDPRFQ